MEDREAVRLRTRLARVIEKSVLDYLAVEDEFLPYLRIEYHESHIQLYFTFPPESSTPSYRLTLQEVVRGGN